MANDMSEIIRQLSFLKAGGKPQGMGFTDKLNQVFQTIANTGEGLKGIAKEAIARKQYETEQKTMQERFGDVDSSVLGKNVGTFTLPELERVSKIAPVIQAGQKQQLSPDQITVGGNLRKEFNTLQHVQDYATVKSNVSIMDNLYKRVIKGGGGGNLIALDQGLITLFNKLTDPSSVVRESEYARTPQNLPMVNRIEGAIEKVRRGGAGLTNADREALILGAKVIANERGALYQQSKDYYSGLSNMIGVGPEFVVGTLGNFTPYEMSVIEDKAKKTDELPASKPVSEVTATKGIADVQGRVGRKLTETESNNVKRALSAGMTSDEIVKELLSGGQ